MRTCVCMTFLRLTLGLVLAVTAAADCCKMTLLILSDSLKWNNELSKYDCGVQKDVRLGKVIRPLPPGHKIWFVYI